MDAGFPSYYDRLGASDYAQPIHVKGTHPLAQHDEAGGHLPAVNDDVDVVSELTLTTELGLVSDVSAHNDYA